MRTRGAGMRSVARKAGRMAGMVLAAGLASGAAAPVWAQDTSGAGEGAVFRADLDPIFLTGSLVGPVGRGWWLGGEAGAGLGMRVTLAPTRDDPDFTPLLHLGVVAARSLAPGWGVEVGARLGIADLLRVCGASDCYPQLYQAGHLLLVRGGGRFRLATRLVVGRQDGEGVLAWSPLVLRVVF